jgi:hypothetical protein
MNYIKRLFLHIKLYYYSILEYFEDGPDISLGDRQVIERSYKNAKLMIGVRKLVHRLRSMNPEDRSKPENLLGGGSYKKSKKELMDELVVRNKVINNPPVKTEDDLVRKVVKQAKAYSKEQEVRDIRKAITTCLKKAGEDPDNHAHTHEALRLKARLGMLKKEIERMKNV